MLAGVNGGRQRRNTVNINRYYCAKTTSVVAKYIFKRRFSSLDWINNRKILLSIKVGFWWFLERFGLKELLVICFYSLFWISIMSGELGRKDLVHFHQFVKVVFILP
jgi:hypothetical protein